MLRPTRFVLALVLSAWVPVVASAKPRLFVLSDIQNEPDDAQSLVRLLVHSNHYDIEGLVATTSCWLRDRTAAWRMREIVDAYAKVHANLDRHEPGFPTAEVLHTVIGEGVPLFGMAGVGAGHDSDGSARLIAAVDRADERPLWVTAWGGVNVLAQALWRVEQDRSAAELAAFVAKLRVYAISDQDDAGPWIRQHYPELFYIVSPGFEEQGANGYHHATWVGISGDEFHGRFDGPDFGLVNNAWGDAHIRHDHGPLGAEYPLIEYMMEGDTPSWIYLFDNGLSDPEHPNWGSWGGRYALYTPPTRPWFHQPETRPIWTDTTDEVVISDGTTRTTNLATVWRWREAMQNEFAARMDWTVKAPDEANHPPVAALAHPARLNAVGGETLILDASVSTDPDGDALSYWWLIYREAGTYAGAARLESVDNATASLTVPPPAYGRPGELHVVVAVTDNGEPSLTRYQRVIVTVAAPR